MKSQVTYKDLGYKSYKDYLDSEHWKNLKIRFYKSKLTKNRCFACGGNKKPLSVHHKTYKRLGKERLMDLALVCQGCHREIHQLHCSMGSKNLWGASMYVIRRRHRR